MDGELLLMILIMIGLVGRSQLITTSACILLVIKLLSLDRYLIIVENRGLETGLLLLTMGVLVPFARGRISQGNVLSMFKSFPGILALIGGAAATYMNREGLFLLKADPQLIVGLVVGSIFGIVFMKGMPSGPLMAAGITAFLMKVMYFFFE